MTNLRLGVREVHAAVPSQPDTGYEHTRNKKSILMIVPRSGENPLWYVASLRMTLLDPSTNSSPPEELGCPSVPRTSLFLAVVVGSKWSRWWPDARVCAMMR